jgi:alkyl sulfatase BDS1-like metallo-beta-lactamase superfamily hydrolase
VAGASAQCSFRLIAAGLALALAATVAQAQTADEPKPASPSTLEFNKNSTASLPWSDKADFVNAKRGLIARLPDNGVIKDKSGRVVWDLSRYAGFIKDGAASPDTVNPSLWRMSQLLMDAGLYEVVPGVYQVRGADLSNLTIVEGEQGITIYDPLISAETARAALDLYYQNRPRKPVVAVIYTHSHVDHAGGVRGVVDESDVKSGKVKIYAPEGFLENFVAENLFAGTAMGRRAAYMYGNLVPPGPQGMVTAGLGITASSGMITLIVPTDLITKTGEKRVIDGIEYEFLMAPGSEAPSEMMWYLPKFRLINTAEDATHTMHNLYTLRRPARPVDRHRAPAASAEDDSARHRQPRALRYLPYGRGRAATADVPGNPVADRPAAGTARASMNGTSGQMQQTTAEVCPLRAEQHVSARRRGQLATLTTCRARGRRFAIA